MTMKRQMFFMKHYLTANKAREVAETLRSISSWSEVTVTPMGQNGPWRVSAKRIKRIFKVNAALL